MVLALALADTLWLQQEAADSKPGPLHRLRTTDPRVAAAIDEGRRRSPTFAALVDAVERSALVVYVARAPTLTHGVEGAVVPPRSPSRYLRILLASRLNPERRVLVLAHELQHVRELIESGTEEHDEASLTALFERIGSRQLGSSTGELYETRAAQQVMAAVQRELTSTR
jgi:hypothetical protein